MYTAIMPQSMQACELSYRFRTRILLELARQNLRYRRIVTLLN